MKLTRFAFVLAIAGSTIAFAQQAGTQTGPEKDSSVIDAQGTAHITRVVPLPEDLSPQARAMVGKRVSDAPDHQTLAQRRSSTDAWQARAGEAMKAVYPAKLVKAEIAGVPVRIVTPLEIPAANRGRVMLNVHGGGFNSDSGSLVESIPIANLTKTKVVSVLYRLAPEHPFPAAVDDTVAVYKELLKTYPAKHIGLYGTSAGAILTGEVAVKLHQLGLPLPGAMGIFSGFGDFSRPGDTWAMYTLDGLSGHLVPPNPKRFHDAEYIGSTNPRDPVLSPLFADVHGFPPTLFISSTRDALLSGTTILQRHFYESGVESPMVVFEGLPHAFWYNVSLPEAREAMGIMARFLDGHVEK
ncbi:MAG: alpha/beta hydrolase [Acidobacteriaceae bacterium]